MSANSADAGTNCPSMNDRDESNFRNVALESGIYTNDGKGTARGEKGISKHIDIVIARNKATQIKDSHIQRSIDTFLNKGSFS